MSCSGLDARGRLFVGPVCNRSVCEKPTGYKPVLRNTSACETPTSYKPFLRVVLHRLSSACQRLATMYADLRSAFRLEIGHVVKKGRARRRFWAGVEVSADVPHVGASDDRGRRHDR